MSEFHAVIWLDHSEANVFHFTVDHFEKAHVESEHPHQKLHRKAGPVGSANAKEDQHFYHQAAELLKGAKEILVVGPGQAKVEFVKHLEHHDPKLKEFIVSVEPMDHPTDGQIVAHARQYFKKADRMLPQV